MQYIAHHYERTRLYKPHCKVQSDLWRGIADAIESYKYPYCDYSDIEYRIAAFYWPFTQGDN